MRWLKRGLVFSPTGDAGWMKTHAQVPTPLPCDGFLRVYFSSRPNPQVSLTTFVDIADHGRGQVLRVNPDPILELGRPGTFDEHGIMPSCAVRDGNDVYLYYSGWSRSVSVPYLNSTGLAVSEDGGVTFRKISQGPILAKNRHDPYSATSPFVMRDGGTWHMWYCSGTNWIRIGDKYEHTYDIKYAHSDDGVAWTPTGATAVAQRTDVEAITRPWIMRLGGTYHMWYCFRGSYGFRDGANAYRLGHAQSADLVTWTRNDNHELSALLPSDSGWDATMIAYPAVVDTGGHVLMFYNGNSFGAEGLGYAELSQR